MNLRLDWCSYEAAKYAVEHWHYSATVPKSKSVYIGAWEDGLFVGTVIFGLGASSHLGSPYGLRIFQAAELTRIALRTHKTAVSRIVSIALTLLARQSPGLRLIVSYADPKQGHHGGIYQALGWVYVGATSSDWAVIDDTGRQWHSRICSVNGIKSQYGRRRRAMRPQDGTKVILPGNHKYLLALDDEIQQRICRLAKPYPKRVRSAESGTEAPTSGGGANPTRTLQLNRKNEHTGGGTAIVDKPANTLARQSRRAVAKL